eukprot:712815-Hanusia_phi.AAC.1
MGGGGDTGVRKCDGFSGSCGMRMDGWRRGGGGGEEERRRRGGGGDDDWRKKEAVCQIMSTCVELLIHLAVDEYLGQKDLD